MAIATCTVTGNIKDLSNAGCSDDKVYSRIYNPPQELTGENTVLDGQEIVSTPNSSGVWTMDLIQGTVVWISIPSANLNKIYTIPAEATKDFDELVEYDP
jgi:hypothetical protein